MGGERRGETEGERAYNDNYTYSSQGVHCVVV